MAKRLAALAKEVPVTQFLEYQDYLGQLYQVAKARFAPYSYLRFAEDLGFSGTNVIRLVIARKRRLAEKSARTIAASLGLKNEDKKYFMNLVRYANVPSQETKADIFMQIYEDKKLSVADNVDKDLMDYYASWQNPLVLELIRLRGAYREPAELQELLYPKIQKEMIQRSVELLERLQMIKWNPGEQSWTVLDQPPHILPEDRAASLYSLAQFHLQMMDIASQCLMLVPRPEREYNALTLRIPAQKISLLKEQIRQFCASLLALETSTEADDRIVQVNIQMFPFTKSAQTEEKKS